MTSFRSCPAVADAFPDTLIAVVTAASEGVHAGPDTAGMGTEEAVGGVPGPDAGVALVGGLPGAVGELPLRCSRAAVVAGQGSWPRSPAKKGTLPRINPAVDSYTAAGRLQDLLAPHSDQTQMHHLGPEAPESTV